MAKVILTDSETGLNKIGLTKLIKETTSLTLKPAKAVTDALLNDEKPILEFSSEEAAREFIASATELGVVCELGTPDLTS